MVFGWCQQADPGRRLHGLAQDAAQFPIFDHVAQGLNALLCTAERCPTKMSTITDLYLNNRLNKRSNRRPQLHGLENLPASERQRGGARIKARLLIKIFAVDGFDHQDAVTAVFGLLGQVQCKTGANKASADNNDIILGC